MKATIDYIKYSIYDTYAVVNGYDQRKKEERVIRIPSKIHYDGRFYPIKGVAAYPDGGFKTKVVEIPNTITSVGFQTIDITENVGEEHTYPNGITVRIYEAREGYKPTMRQLKKNTVEKQNKPQGIIAFFLAFLKKIFKSKSNIKEEIQKKRILNEGTLPGVFTLRDGRKIRFSKGNLQFHPLNNTFRFAEQQYETLGKEANEKCSPTLDGWIDLFCWGTSGYKGYLPTENNIEICTCDYRKNHDMPCGDIVGNNVCYDWGVFNPISNGGNQKGLWRTPLAEEWDYLVKDRPNAENLKLTCTLCERKGFVLLPNDFWSNCSSLNFTIDVNNSKPFSTLFDSVQWKQLESLGAVFFPESEVILLTMDSMKYLNKEPIYLRRYWGTKIAIFTATEELSKACIDGAAGKYVYREKYPIRLIQDVK